MGHSSDSVCGSARKGSSIFGLNPTYVDVTDDVVVNGHVVANNISAKNGLQ